ncbi:MAG: hypothetical protein RDU30_07300 [Desulfovibrionaceae bacterium]|nr:hypothetical protein [Desulfovibrionaceae bacterium]
MKNTNVFFMKKILLPGVSPTCPAGRKPPHKKYARIFYEENPLVRRQPNMSGRPQADP